MQTKTLFLTSGTKGNKMLQSFLPIQSEGISQQLYIVITPEYMQGCIISLD
jgi:hypothetical protein